MSQYRSAGACPPRASGRPQHGEGQALALRGRGRFSTKNPSRYRIAGAVPASFRWTSAWRGTGPRPTRKGGRFSTKNPSRYRIAGSLGCHTRIREGFPRDVEQFMKHPDLSLTVPSFFGNNFSLEKLITICYHKHISRNPPSRHFL